MKAQDILNELNNSIKQFGSYHYEDGSVHEVMNLSPIVNSLVGKSVQEIVQVLTDLYNLDNKIEMLISEVAFIVSKKLSPQDLSILENSKIVQDLEIEF